MTPEQKAEGGERLTNQEWALAEMKRLRERAERLEECVALLDEACRSGFMPAEFVRRADRQLAGLSPSTPEAGRPRPDYDPRVDHPERYTDGPI